MKIDFRKEYKRVSSEDALGEYPQYAGDPCGPIHPSIEYVEWLETKLQCALLLAMFGYIDINYGEPKNSEEVHRVTVSHENNLHKEVVTYIGANQCLRETGEIIYLILWAPIK